MAVTNGEVLFATGSTTCESKTAANTRSALSLLSRLAARVTTQFDKTSSTTLANVTGLSVTVVAAKVYSVRALLWTTCAAAGGCKVALSGTATATSIRYTYRGVTTAGAVSQSTTQATALDTALGETAALMQIEIMGTVTVNAGGTLTVQFAQNANNGTASSVLVGSTLEVQEVA